MNYNYKTIDICVAFAVSQTEIAYLFLYEYVTNYFNRWVLLIIAFKVWTLVAISADLGDIRNLRCPIIFFAHKWSVTHDMIFEVASAGICYLQSELHIKYIEQYNNYYWLNNSFNIYHCINILHSLYYLTTARHDRAPNGSKW